MVSGDKRPIWEPPDVTSSAADYARQLRDRAKGSDDPIKAQNGSNTALCSQNVPSERPIEINGCIFQIP
jgi:hypothetical protein